MKRYQQSFMKTPPISWFQKEKTLDEPTSDELRPTYRTSYMFSGFDDTKNQGELPEIFQPYLNCVNQMFPDCHFNQVSINWYENGEDYIPFHRDCQEFMTGNKHIAILTFNEFSNTMDEIPRTLELKLSQKYKTDEFFQLSDKMSIELLHGSVVVLTPEIQNFYRHGIRKMKGGKKRISMSFRQF